MEITSTFYSTGTVSPHQCSMRRITYSSQKLRDLNNVNQAGKLVGGERPKPRLIPYNAMPQ